MRKKGMSNDKIQKMVDIQSKITNIIQELKLKPIIRTIYNRISYQENSDSKLRIVIDTNIQIIKEPANPGTGRWCRDMTMPILPADIINFPFAVLEIKFKKK